MSFQVGRRSKITALYKRVRPDLSVDPIFSLREVSCIPHV